MSKAVDVMSESTEASYYDYAFPAVLILVIVAAITYLIMVRESAPFMSFLVRDAKRCG